MNNNGISSCCGKPVIRGVDNYIVCGGCGFIGTKFAEYAVKNLDAVISGIVLYDVDRGKAEVPALRAGVPHHAVPVGFGDESPPGVDGIYQVAGVDAAGK